MNDENLTAENVIASTTEELGAEPLATDPTADPNPAAHTESGFAEARERFEPLELTEQIELEDPQSAEPRATDELKSASRALREAISGLSKALGSGLVGVGADVSREIAEELTAASQTITKELAEAVPGSKRAAKSAQTRQDLMRAAAEVIAAKGYEAASVADIAKAAGYTKGALYAHFDSKEELFLATMTEGQTELLANSPEMQPEAHPLEAAYPRKEQLPQLMLALEAYLYGLRHPENRAALFGLARASLDAVAAQVHYHRTGNHGAPTPGERETALGLACIYNTAGVLVNVLPDDNLGPQIDALAQRVIDTTP